MLFYVYIYKFCVLGLTIDLTSERVYMGVVFYQGGIVRLVFHRDSLSPVWSLRVIFHQCGLSYQGGLSSG